MDCKGNQHTGTTKVIDAQCERIKKNVYNSIKSKYII